MPATVWRTRGSDCPGFVALKRKDRPDLALLTHTPKVERHPRPPAPIHRLHRSGAQLRHSRVSHAPCGIHECRFLFQTIPAVWRVGDSGRQHPRPSHGPHGSVSVAAVDPAPIPEGEGGRCHRGVAKDRAGSGNFQEDAARGRVESGGAAAGRRVGPRALVQPETRDDRQRPIRHPKVGGLPWLRPRGRLGVPASMHLGLVPALQHVRYSMFATADAGNYTRMALR